MAYPVHWLLAFGGHSGDVAETWTCGIRLANYGGDLLDPMDEENYLDTVAVTALKAWFTRTDSQIASVAVLQWVKFNKINGEGEYDDQSTTHERRFADHFGSTATPLHPLQVAMCLSWRTNDIERGIGSHGRIYSPRPAVVVGSSGDVAGPDRVKFANSAATLLNTLDIPMGTGVLRPSIVSPGRGWPEIRDQEGAKHQIDTVVVDSSLDIQRRRSRSQTKEVTSAPIVY